MGAWCYCPKCDAGQDKPSVYEVIDGYRLCQWCGFKMEPGQTKDDLITEMAEDINTLKEELARQIEKFDDLQALVWKMYNQGPNP